MESVSSTTSAASEYGVQQFMRQAARHSAEQAARSLKAQAGSALRAADTEAKNAHFLQAQSLEFKANNALLSADRAEKKASSLPQRPRQDQADSAKLRPAASDAAQQDMAAGPQTSVSAAPQVSAPSMNLQNEVVGVFINTTA